MRFWSLIWKLAGVVIFIIGLSGVPGDIETWKKWIDNAMYDARVNHLAQKAVEIANFANQWWVRGLLIGAGLTILFWAWRPFWRLRHRFVFRWRRMLANQVWISRDQALKVMAESAWGRIKEPRSTTIVPLTALAGAFRQFEMSTGLTEDQKNSLLFRKFLGRSLDHFCSDNPSAVRESDGNEQIEELALRRFLEASIEGHVKEKFGDIPRHKVT
jgi:hypothetical protein